MRLMGRAPLKCGSPGQRDDPCPGQEMAQEDVRFHHATQKAVQFEMYELFISGLFHLIFLDGI